MPPDPTPRPTRRPARWLALALAVATAFPGVESLIAWLFPGDPRPEA